MQYDLRNFDASKLKRKKKFFPGFTIDTAIATFLFVGLIPFAPGTFGTLAVYPIYYFVTETQHIAFLGFESLKMQIKVILFALAVLLTIIGTWAIAVYQRRTLTFDHKSVVIDEVVGMLLTLAISFDWLYEISTNLLLHILDWKLRNLIFLAAFIAFRYFDIRKPFFIRTIDIHYKKPFGVMLDDIVAALFASGSIYVVYLITDIF